MGLMDSWYVEQLWVGHSTLTWVLAKNCERGFDTTVSFEFSKSVNIFHTFYGKYSPLLSNLFVDFKIMTHEPSFKWLCRVVLSDFPIVGRCPQEGRWSAVHSGKHWLLTGQLIHPVHVITMANIPRKCPNDLHVLLSTVPMPYISLLLWPQYWKENLPQTFKWWMIQIRPESTTGRMLSFAIGHSGSTVHHTELQIQYFGHQACGHFLHTYTVQLKKLIESVEGGTSILPVINVDQYVAQLSNQICIPSYCVLGKQWFCVILNSISLPGLKHIILNSTYCLHL